MKVVESHRSPLSRQVQEGVEIETNGAEVLMNSKSEWNQSRLPRIIIEAGGTQTEDKESGLGQRDEEGRKQKKKLSRDKRRTRSI